MDVDKINYVLSLLRGTALEFFQPKLLSVYEDKDPPAWMGSLMALNDELTINFGPTDDVEDAKDKLDVLHLGESERIVKFDVKFQKLAVKVSYGDNALRHAYYHVLPKCIKDVLATCGGCQKTLIKLKTLAREIDRAYWIRENEKQREAHAAGRNRQNNSTSSSSNNLSNNSGGRSNNSGNRNSSNSGKKSANNNSQANSGGSVKTSGTPNPISNLLGKDGKLKPEEKEHRWKEGLCMFCGGKAQD